MPLEIKVQFEIVIYSIISGILTGIIFDLYRIVRGTKGYRFIIIVEDILFWILAAIIIFSFLLYMNYAFLGPYVYFFMLSSFFMYLKFISLTVYKLERIMINKTYFIARIILKKTTYILKSIYYNVSGKINLK